MLYLAVEYNENQLNPINIVGLVICLTGIVFHCVLKFYTIQSTRATMSSKGCLRWICFFFLVEEKQANHADHALSERLLLHRLESIDEWSLDGESNTRRTSLHD